MTRTGFRRRTFLAAAGGLPCLTGADLVGARRALGAPKRKIPIGIEIYSVKEEEKKDILGTLRALSKMGYEGVEFWAPYLEWTPDKLKQVRKQLDDLGMRCFSTHNRAHYFEPDTLGKAIEYNQALGSGYVVMDQPPKGTEGEAGWKKVAELLTTSHARLKKAGLSGGFHNVLKEWRALPVEGGGKGTRPIDILTANTPKDFAFQLDTATCMAEGADPVAFIKTNPGRVKSYHLKDWSPDKQKGYKVLLGEGIGPWKQIVAAAESVGGVEYYLIEQEGSRFSPLETAKRCLENFKKLRG